MRHHCPVGGQIRCLGSRNTVGHLFDHYAALQHDWGWAYSTCRLTRQVTGSPKTRSSHASHGAAKSSGSTILRASFNVAAIALPKPASVRAQEEIQMGPSASPMPCGDK